MTPGTTCYTLTLDQANAESYYKIATTGIAHIVMFAEHLPVEFEDTAHYLVNTVGMGTDAEVDVEPSAQKPDPAGKCCESQMDMFEATADSMKATIGAFKSVVAYHDLCGHDELPPMVEQDFHDYEANCAAHFCNAVEKGVDQLACPSPPPPSTDVEVGAVIGIAVGAGVALILLGACICFMYVREADLHEPRRQAGRRSPERASAVTSSQNCAAAPAAVFCSLLSIASSKENCAA